MPSTRAQFPHASWFHDISLKHHFAVLIIFIVQNAMQGIWILVRRTRLVCILFLVLRTGEHNRCTLSHRTGGRLVGLHDSSCSNRCRWESSTLEGQSSSCLPRPKMDHGFLGLAGSSWNHPVDSRQSNSRKRILNVQVKTNRATIWSIMDNVFWTSQVVANVKASLP